MTRIINFNISNKFNNSRLAKAGDEIVLTLNFNQRLDLTGGLLIPINIRPNLILRNGELLQLDYLSLSLSSNQKSLIYTATMPDSSSSNGVDLTGLVVAGVRINGSTENFVMAKNLNTRFVIDNTPPQIISAPQVVVKETSKLASVIYQAKVSSASGRVSYAIAESADSNLFKIDSKSGQLSLLFAPDYEASNRPSSGYQLQLIAQDAAGNTTKQILTIQIKAVNEPSQLNQAGIGYQAFVKGSTSASLVVSQDFSDPENDTLRFRAIGLPAGLTLRQGTISGEPARAGKYHISVIADDGVKNGLDAKRSYLLEIFDKPQIFAAQMRDSVGHPQAGKAADRVNLSVTLSEHVLSSDHLSANNISPLLSTAASKGQAISLSDLTLTESVLDNKTVLQFQGSLPAGLNSQNVWLIGLSLRQISLSGVQSNVSVSWLPSQLATAYRLDNIAPIFISPCVQNVSENLPAHSPLYVARVRNQSGQVSFRLANLSDSDTDDTSLLSINPTSGVVTLLNPSDTGIARLDFESKASYRFKVIATDLAGNAAEREVSVNVQNINEPPQISGNLLSNHLIKGRATLLSNNWQVADQDGVAQNLVLTLVAKGGKISLPGIGGVKQVYAANKLTLSGIAEDLNSALAQLSFTAITNSASMRLTLSDDAKAGKAKSSTVQYLFNVLEHPIIEAMLLDESGINMGKRSDLLTFSLLLSEQVTLSGTPTQQNLFASLAVSGNPLTDVRFLQMTQQNGKSALQFSARLPAGDGTQLQLHQFSLANDLTLSGVVSGGRLASQSNLNITSHLLLDNSPPSVTSVSLAAASQRSGYLRQGDVLTLSLFLSEAVSFSELPSLNFLLGNLIVEAAYDATLSTNTCAKFTYTISASDNDSNGISIADNALQNNEVSDLVGNLANLMVPVLADQTGFKVDNQAPQIAWLNPTKTSTGYRLLLQFNEQIQHAYLADFVLTDADGQVLPTLTLASLTLTGNQISLQLNGEISQRVYLTYRGNRLSDFAGNPVEPIQQWINFYDFSLQALLAIGTAKAVSVAPTGQTGGMQVSYLGDVNGDGFADVAISSTFADSNQPNLSNISRVYVVFGASHGWSITDLTQLSNDKQNKGFVIYAENNATDTMTDLSISGAGDINGDGLADIVIGAPGYQQDQAGSGRAYLVYGKNNGYAIQLSVMASENYRGNLGFLLNAESESIIQLGKSLSAAGDVNGDGLDDVIISAIDADTGSAISYFLFGSSHVRASINLQALVSQQAGLILYSNNQLQQSSYQVQGVGDVNGDGLADLLVSIASSDNPELANQAMLYVVFGSCSSQSLQLSELNQNSSGFQIEGKNNIHLVLAESIAGIGDINGDGLADILIGAYRNGNPAQEPISIESTEHQERAYVVYGKTNTETVYLSELASQGFFISAGNSAQWLSKSASAAGDINGDGLQDYMLSAPYAEVNGMQYAGRVYVLYGSRLRQNISLSDVVNGTGGFVINGSSAGQLLGFSISTAGDINGDGFTDFIISSGNPTDATANLNASNQAYIVFGGTQLNLGGLNHYVSSSGAVTGSAADEVLVGSAGSDTLVGGGGLDRFFAGAGNDVIVLTSADMVNLSQQNNGAIRAIVNGGGGIDSIRLTGGAALDLTLIANSAAGNDKLISPISSIEVIDLVSDNLANRLVLSSLDIVDMVGNRSFDNTIGKRQLLVMADPNNDQVDIDAPLGTSWRLLPQRVQVNGQSYDVYSVTGTSVQLLVSQGVQINWLFADNSIVSVDQRAFNQKYSDTFEWQSPEPILVSDINKALSAGAIKIVSANGAVRQLGAGATFEAAFPERLILDTKFNASAMNNLNFVQITDDIPDFDGFTHYGEDFEVDESMPVYQSTINNWYLWSPKGWFGRYILSQSNAEYSDWWIGGNTVGLGTVSQPREGVLQAGHWFHNYGQLTNWDSAWRNWWSAGFNISAASSVQASRWSLSLGQGNTVQPGDYFMIDSTKLEATSQLRNLFSGNIKLPLPSDITRPQYDSATVIALRDDRVVTDQTTLEAGDKLVVVIQMSEPMLIKQSDWTNVNAAELGIYIGATQRWATFDRDASLLYASSEFSSLDQQSVTEFISDKLAFTYTIANGDMDSYDGIKVGMMNNYTTRFFDTHGNRLWTNQIDVVEKTNLIQVRASDVELEMQQNYVQALIPKSKNIWQSNNADPPVTVIKYAFMKDWPDYYIDGNDATYKAEPDTPFVAWNDSMKTVFDGIVRALEKAVNIDFQFVDEVEQAHIALGAYAMRQDIGGYGYFPPNQNVSIKTGNYFGDFWLNATTDANSSYTRYAMAHELGHTLGLKHPGLYDVGDSYVDGPFLSAEQDNSRLTVMSYNQGLGMSGKYPNSYMIYDIAALQYLYGAKDYHTSNDTITLQYPSFSANLNAFDFIYDTGGIDTLTVSNTTNPLELNLNQGEFSSIGFNDNFAICFGTVIENVIGQSGSDIIIGNTANNRITGGAGSDTFVFGSEWGDDIITDFLPGSDIISFARDASINFASLNIQVNINNQETIISHGNDSIKLLNVTAALSASNFYFVLG